MPSKQVRKQLQAQYDRRITEEKRLSAAKRRGGVAGVAQESNAASGRQDDVNEFLTAYSATSDAEKADFGKFVKKYGKSLDKSVKQSVKKGNLGTYAQAKTTANEAEFITRAGQAQVKQAGMNSKIEKIQDSNGKNKFTVSAPSRAKGSRKAYLTSDLVAEKEKIVTGSIDKARNARVALGKALGFKEDKNRVKRPATQFVRKQAKRSK